MTYAILIIILAFVLYMVYRLYHDFLSPSFIYTSSMIISVLCAGIGLIYWNNISKLKIITMLIILVSVVSFCCGELIARNCYRKVKDSKRKNIVKEKAVDYNVDWWKIVVEILFVLITAFLLYSEIKRIAIIGGYTSGGFGEMIGRYRELSALFTTDIIKNGQGINIIVSQMRKVCEVLCYINIFFLIKNIVDNKKDKKNIGYIIIILLGFLLSLLTAGRMQMLIYCISAVFMFVVLKLKNYSFLELGKKYIKKFIVFVIILVAGFYLILPLSGRSTNTNIVSYMSFYLGTSIPSLDIYLDNEVPESNFFGEETLRGIQTVLFKLKLSDYIQPVSKEWITFEDENNQPLQSNIFTSGKRYYHDFGWIGIIVCQLIFSICFSLLYLIAMDNKKAIPVIFIAMYYFIVIDQVRDELFFADFVHINTIFKFAMLYIIFNVLTKDIFAYFKMRLKQ